MMSADELELDKNKRDLQTIQASPKPRTIQTRKQQSHLRQSFKPGEIDPAEANKIGYELAMRFTKGNHAFVVATHMDKGHIHNHIIFNSTNIDNTRKFTNPWLSSLVVRKISDFLCVVDGLSIIENPKPSKGHYGDWLGDKKRAVRP